MRSATDSAKPTADELADAIADVAAIDAIPQLLRIVCETTGMGFSAVAHVTEGSWTACAVHDEIGFGLAAGGALDIETTLCRESRLARSAIAIDEASTDPVYRDHHTLRIYGIQSYVSVPIVLPDGEYFGNLCAIDPRPARVSEPRVMGMIHGFAALIASQLAVQRVHERRRRALVDAQAERELREQFIAILGHDLREPLQTISAGAEVLQLPSWGLDPKFVSVVAGISRSSRRMKVLIGDILDFARGRLGGGFGLQLREVHDVGDALREIVAEQQLSHPNSRIVTEIETSRLVRCDLGRVQQLAANLLGNALLHGAPDAPVHFSAKIDRDAIVITVTNSGDPIPESALPHIFTPFWRQNTSATRQGLGLGLFISSEIAKAHHGTLEVISAAGTGTTFAARLPIGIDER